MKKIVSALFVLTALVLVGCSNNGKSGGEMTTEINEAGLPELIGLNQAQYREVTSSEPLVLVDFHATWCRPCREMAPDLVALQNKYGKDIKIVKIDIDRNQELANAFNISSVPTIRLYNDGSLVYDRPGKLSSNRLEKLVAPFLNE